MRLTTLLGALACASISLVGAEGQEDGDDSLFQTLQDHFRRSNELLTQFFKDAPFPSLDAFWASEDTKNEVADAKEDVACHTAISLLRNSAKWQKEAETTGKILHERIRVESYEHPTSVQCEELSSNELIQKCRAILEQKDQLGALLATHQTEEEICAQLQDAPVVQEPLMPTAAENVSCRLCKRFVQIVDDYVEDDLKQVEQARLIIGDICDALSPDSMCHVFLQKFDLVVAWVRHGMDPQVVCMQIAMCDGPKLIEYKPEAKMLMLEETSTTEVEPGNAPCFFCTYVAFIIHFFDRHMPNQLPGLEMVLQMSCQMMPQKFSCENVESHFDKIVKLLREGKEYTDACREISSCPKDALSLAVSVDDPASLSSAISELVLAFENEKAVAGDATECYYCDFIVTLVEIAMQEKPEYVQQLRGVLDMVCTMLGSEDQCHAYLKQLDSVMDALQQKQTPRQICTTQLHYCQSQSLESLMLGETLGVAMEELMQTVNIDSCFLCTQMGTIFKIALAQDPDQIAQLRQAADLVCDFLPPDSKCHPIVKMLDQEIDSLKRGEDPKEICKDMKFCPASTMYEDLISLYTEGVGAPTPSPTDHSKCAYCSGVLTVLEVALHMRPDQVNQVRQAAGVVCDMLPADDECHDDLRMFDEAVTLLQKGEGPHDVCIKLQYCGRNENVDAKVMDLAMLDAKTNYKDECAVCKSNSLLLASLSAGDDSIRAFKDMMNKVCLLVPDTPECTLVLDHHDDILRLIEQDKFVEEICEDLSYCQNTHNEGAMSCMLCEYTGEIVKHTKDNEEALRVSKQALETLCTVLPPAAHCDLLSASFDSIVKKVKNGESVAQVCDEVKMCGRERGDMTMEEDEVKQVVEQWKQVLATERN